MSSERIKLPKPKHSHAPESSALGDMTQPEPKAMPSASALQRLSRWVVGEFSVRLRMRGPFVAPSASPDQIRRDIQVWENEGGAVTAVRSQDWYRFGKRIEADGTWTIYHVFSGVPAKLGSWAMFGLNAHVAERALHIINKPPTKDEN